MIVPSADRISSKTPSAPFVDEAPYFERMKAAFSKDGQWIDLTQEFCDKTEELYYHTDHHWTTSAAYLAYLDYMKAIGRTPAFVPAQHPCATAEGFFGTLYSKSKLYHATADTLDYYPDLTARMILKQGATKQDEEIAAAAGLKDEIVDLYDESKLDTRDKYAMFLHGNNAFSRIEGRGEGKILVIKDSYANCFVPFLTEDYAQVDVIDLRSFKASVDRVMEENVYDNVLILYNFQSYHEDQNIVKLNFYNKA
ncbi:MAG: DHHW family protein [Pygmaiobacter sp.]